MDAAHAVFVDTDISLKRAKVSFQESAELTPM